MKKLFFYPHHSGVVCSKNNSGLPLVSFMPKMNGTIGDLKRSLHVCTPNPGNMIHSESASRIFDFDVNGSAKGNLSAIIKNHESIDEVADYFNKNFDALVLNFANDVRVGWESVDHKNFSSLFKRLSIKIFIFGLGMQEDIEGDISLLSEGVRSFLYSANDNAEFIGVRGFYTERWLHGQGIDKAVALGCPSMYRHPRNVIQAIDRSCSVTPKKVVSAGYAHHKERHKILVDLFKEDRIDTASYIFQNDLFSVFNSENYHSISGVYDPATSQVDFDTVDDRLRDIHRSCQPFSQYAFFTNSNAWLQFNSHFDLFVGDRLHAAVAALMAGTPAILLYQDLRVKELIDFYRIPSENLNDLEGMTISGLASEKFIYSGLDKFKEVYIGRLRMFEEFCSGFGLSFLNGHEVQAGLANS